MGSGSTGGVDMWALSADELEFIKMIGEGSFGKVGVRGMMGGGKAGCLQACGQQHWPVFVHG